MDRDLDELADELEENGEHLDDLLKRSNQHKRDISELKEELALLKEDLSEEPIPSESQTATAPE